jgi:hypothetical protein
MMDRREMLLIQLMEEAGEVVQAASKVLRFGTNHTWPAGPEKLLKTAEYRLSNEIIDFMALFAMLQDEGVVSKWGTDFADRIQQKRMKVELYLDMSKNLERMQ